MRLDETPRVQIIRQTAALPYRIDGTTEEPTVQVLLVTSRGTGRWVIPKGNHNSGLSAHASAALEAQEEAGVRGALCPIPLGSFQYRKLRGSGATLMVSVEVFPLSVHDIMPSWKEQSQRERKWFSLSEAANAVDEPDLRDLIRSFAPAEFKAAVRRTGALSTMTRHTGLASMFGWFQRLLPRTGNFFEMFEAHAATVLSGAEATARLLAGGPNAKDHIKEISEREHDADNITREVLQTVRKTFLTPFDRGAITALIGALDDTIDEMHAAAAAIDLYELTEFTTEMQDMAGIVVDAARLAAEAMPLLRDIS
ncbi:MAG: DUF47 family protein, partial [Burkholderiales bacterium]